MLVGAMRVSIVLWALKIEVGAGEYIP